MLSFAALRARICSRAMCRPIASAMRVSAASTATGSQGAPLSFAAARRSRRGTSSSCMAGLPGIARVAIDAIAGGIGDPAVDGGFMPSGAVNADPHLRREGSFGDLAVERRSRQPGAGKDGLEADDAVGGVQGAYSIG